MKAFSKNKKVIKDSKIIKKEVKYYERPPMSQKAHNEMDEALLDFFNQ